MKKLISLLIFIGFISCNSETEVNTTIEEKVDSISTIETENALDSIHPNNLSDDLSWIVGLDIQEGFLLSYTITYQNGDTLTRPAKDLLIGGVDYPPAHFINDTTYFVPNIGSSKNGHYEMYIYYSGRAEYKEVVISN